MDQADVIILGGGLVGSALAVALDAHGLTAIVVDIADPQVILAAGFDGRASAIASAPYRMLETIGVVERLKGLGCPIRGIRVSDGSLSRARSISSPMPIAVRSATCSRTGSSARRCSALAQAAAGVDLRMKTRAVSVERGEHGVVAVLDSGRDDQSAAADRRRRPQFADPRCCRPQGRALDL